MSRWIKHKAFKTDKAIWCGIRYIYSVHTDQKDFIVQTTDYRLNYKDTCKNLYKKGFTNVQIAYLGRNVSI